MKIVITIILSFFLNACVSQSSINYGNFLTTNDNKAYSDFVAKDAIKLIQAKFPNREITFVLLNKMRDPFGSHLIRYLRSAGYKIIPYSKGNDKLITGSLKDNSLLLKAKTLSFKIEKIFLNYSFTPVGKTNLLALTLNLNDISVRKVFFKENQKIHSAGPWIQGIETWNQKV